MWILIEVILIWLFRIVYGYLFNFLFGYKLEIRLLYKWKYFFKWNDLDFLIKKEKFFVICNKLKYLWMCLSLRWNKWFLGVKEILSEIMLLCYFGILKEGNIFYIVFCKIVNIFVNFIVVIFVFDMVLELKDLRVFIMSMIWELIIVVVNWILFVSNRVIGFCL